jgi:hypothetical protein
LDYASLTLRPDNRAEWLARAEEALIDALANVRAQRKKLPHERKPWNLHVLELAAKRRRKRGEVYGGSAARRGSR